MLEGGVALGEKNDHFCQVDLVAVVNIEIGGGGEGVVWMTCAWRMVVFFANTGVENRSLQMFDVKAIATCSDKKQRQTNERTERQAGRQRGKQTDRQRRKDSDGRTDRQRQTDRHS